MPIYLSFQQAYSSKIKIFRYKNEKKKQKATSVLNFHFM